MFQAMQKADSTMLKPLFTTSARLQTVINKQGDVSVRDEAIAGFINSIGKAKAGALDERLSGMEIKIDADLATAWTPYVFYYQGAKHHCGVNAFTLVKMGGNWKIQTIIDTRRTENCPDLPKQ
ncbi:nuclear transport factor 2 family protein [Spirosoma flavus]